MNDQSNPSSLYSLLGVLKLPVRSAAVSSITPSDISSALSCLLSDGLSRDEARELLIGLHAHGFESRADVLASCSRVMRSLGTPAYSHELSKVMIARRHIEGRYSGGFCDIVGTGGDSHNTFNVSTTSSVVASSLLLVSKHGSRASTSRSGSADVLEHMLPMPPVLAAVNAKNLPKIFSVTNYAFLFAPTFHPLIQFAAPIRKSIPHPTIFNLLGPLGNPLQDILEACVIGVRHHSLGPVFADALRLAGVKKALVVCGKEELDEISCAGRTLCWMLSEASTLSGVVVEHFTVEPADFGVSPHSLAEVIPRNGPDGNAQLLKQILRDEMPSGHPVLDFVLINTAALFVVSGICDADSSNMGLGDNGAVVMELGPGHKRWKEGVRRAKWAIKSGAAWKQWQAFVEVTCSLKAE